MRPTAGGRDRARTSRCDRRHSDRRRPCRAGPADLDPPHHVEVEQVAPGGGELAHAERVSDRHPIDFHANPVAVQPADREALPAEAVAIANRIHAGFVAHQVGDRLHLAALHGRAVDLADRPHQLADRLGDLAGHHHHPVQGAPRLLRVGLPRLHCRRHPQQAGQDARKRSLAGQRAGSGHRRWSRVVGTVRKCRRSPAAIRAAAYANPPGLSWVNWPTRRHLTHVNHSPGSWPDNAGKA